MEHQTILVAVDPSRNYHPALERVIHNASLSTLKTKLHLFIAVDANASKLNQQKTSSTPLKVITDLISTVEALGVECESELSWDELWQEGMLAAAKRIQADLIVMTDHSNVPRNILLADSKWMLLRKAKRPVMLVRSGASDRRERVLAAINIQANDEAHRALNKRIIEAGRELAHNYGAELHVVNAYQDSMNYPDRGKLVRQSNVDTSLVHVKKGHPEHVVADIADEIQADVVVIGTMARKSMLDSIRGNTSERVLNNLRLQDILTIN